MEPKTGSQVRDRLCPMLQGTARRKSENVAVHKTIVVRGDPEDIAKLKAIYRMLHPDWDLEFVEKPLEWAPSPSKGADDTKRMPVTTGVFSRKA